MSPLPDSFDIRRPFEIVSVFGLAQPLFLACRLARLSAGGLGTILLATFVPGVRDEQLSAVRAFRSFDSFHSRKASWAANVNDFEEKINKIWEENGRIFY